MVFLFLNCFHELSKLTYTTQATKSTHNISDTDLERTLGDVLSTIGDIDDVVPWLFGYIDTLKHVLADLLNVY